jgi:hypothetical protein
MAVLRSWKALLSSWKRRRASAEGVGRHPKSRTLRVEPLEQREMLTVSAPDGIGLYNPTTSYFDLRHTNSAGSANLRNYLKTRFDSADNHPRTNTGATDGQKKEAS